MSAARSGRRLVVAACVLLLPHCQAGLRLGPVLPPRAPAPARAVDERLAVLFVPGIDGTGRCGQRQWRRLQHWTRSIDALTIDPDDRSSFEEIVAFVLEGLRERRAAGCRTLLVGESLGGVIALGAAIAEPRLIDSLALFNPATSITRSWIRPVSQLVASYLPDSLYTSLPGVITPLFGGISWPEALVGREVGLPAPAELLEVGRALSAVLPAQTLAHRLGVLEDGSARVNARLDAAGAAGGASWPWAARCALVATSADLVLPSAEETARLQRCLPGAYREVVDGPGHVCLDDERVNLVQLLLSAGCFDVPRAAAAPPAPTAPQPPERPQPPPVQPPPAKQEAQAAAPPAPTAPQPPERPQPPPVPQPPPAKQEAQAGVPPAPTVPRPPERPQPPPVQQPPPQQQAQAGVQSATRAARAAQRVAKPAGRLVPPSPLADERISQLEGVAKLVSPVFFSTRPDGSIERGVHAVPLPSELGGRPVLFVGNHQLMGLDGPLLVRELLLERGTLVRSLVFPALMDGSSPLEPLEYPPRGTADVFKAYGARPASARALLSLLGAGEAVLLFPGGGREVFKRKGERYRLFWPSAPDLVRLAARCDALLVPFSGVGSDELVELLLDTDELLALPGLGPWLRERASALPSLVPDDYFVPPLIAPRADGLPRHYWLFGKPLDTRQLDATDAGAVRAAYDGLQASVAEGVELLLRKREEDPFANFALRTAYEQLVDGKQAPSWTPQ